MWLWVSTWHLIGTLLGDYHPTVVESTSKVFFCVSSGYRGFDPQPMDLPLGSNTKESFPGSAALVLTSLPHMKILETKHLGHLKMELHLGLCTFALPRLFFELALAFLCCFHYPASQWLMVLCCLYSHLVWDKSIFEARWVKQWSFELSAQWRFPWGKEGNRFAGLTEGPNLRACSCALGKWVMRSWEASNPIHSINSRIYIFVLLEEFKRYHTTIFIVALLEFWGSSSFDPSEVFLIKSQEKSKTSWPREAAEVVWFLQPNLKLDSICSHSFLIKSKHTAFKRRYSLISFSKNAYRLGW